MTVRKLMTATVVALGVAGSAVAQDPTPVSPDRTAQPDQTTPDRTTQSQPAVAPTPTPPVTAQPTTTTPGVVQGGYVMPMTYTYPQGQIVPSGYSAPMTYTYPQGQLVPGGYTTTPMTYTQPAAVSYGTPAMAGTSGVIYPGTGYTPVGTTPVFGTGYATYPSFANGYPTMSSYNGGVVSNVISTPTRAARRLFRR